MDIKNIILFVVAVTNLCLAFLIYLRSSKKSGHLAYSFFVFFVGLWAFTLVIFRYASDLKISLLWMKFAYIAAVGIACSLLYFIFAFVSDSRLGYNKKILIFIPTLIVAFSLLSSDFLVKEVVIKPWGKDITTVNWGHWIFTVYFVSFFFGALFFAWYKYKNTKGLLKIQLLYIILGITVAGLFGSFFNLFIPLFQQTHRFVWLGPLFTVFIVYFTGYAITRYRLMDIRIAFRKGVVYLLAAAFAYGSFYFVSWLFNILFGSIYARNAFIFAILVAIIFVILFFSFNDLIKRLANKYLFGRLYSQHEAIKRFSQQLTAIIDLDKLVNSVADIVQKTLSVNKFALFIVSKANRCRLYRNIGFNQQEIVSLICNDSLINEIKQRKTKPLIMEELKVKTEASIILPLIVKNTLRGIIVLGEKTADGIYSKEDTELLETLANQTSIALENARLYDQVQDLTDNLQEKVAEQTKNITRLLEMKTEFLRIVNHQLRTPTSIVKGMLSMIVEGSFKGKEKNEAIEKVYISSERLETILDDLLNAQNLIGKELTLHLEPIELSLIIENTIKEFETVIRRRKLKVVFNQPKEKIPVFLLDRHLVEIILKKIIDNAVVYTIEGKISIDLQKMGKDIQISITDTGIGIFEEDLPKLFQLFQRGQNAERVHPNGSGLGLFIAKGYLEAHHGTIRLESQLGQGTKATIVLPMREA